ncbi:MAG: RNA polymerase factor sigma-32 [Alphaproteobacteria bacterium]|nr:RNA polymerase factor sigma-32 [Alphaproteobacteria bacterium]
MGHIDNTVTRQADRCYLRAAMSKPLLTREHELDPTRRWRDSQDEAALHELIGAYHRLAVSMATRFRHYGLPMSDLVQEGVVGLMQAARRFDPERDVRFSTYAAWWIRAAIQDYVLRNWSIVRTGTTAAQKALFFNLRRLRARLDGGNDGTMTPEDRKSVAATLGVPVTDVEIMEQRLGGSDLSLNAPVGTDGDGEWQNFLTDTRPSPEEEVTERHDGAIRRKWLRQALEELPARERRIIVRRLLNEDAATLASLGSDLGVSKERVRQLEQRALDRLRRSLAAHIQQPRDLLHQCA